MTPRTRNLLLLGSLAANLFFAGMWSARWLRPSPPPPELHSPPAEEAPGAEPEETGSDRGARPGGRNGPPGDLTLLRQVARTMGGRSDARVRAVLRRDREEVRGLRQRLVQRHQTIQQALLAEPYEEQKLLKAFEELHETRTATAKRATAALVELSSKMTRDERARLRRRLDASRERPRGDRPGRPNQPKGPRRERE